MIIKQKPDRLGSYNCGGYALRTYTWFMPYIDSWGDSNAWSEEDYNDYDSYNDESRELIMTDMMSEGYDYDSTCDAIIEKDCAFIIDHCPFLKIVDINDTAPDDRIIAYRIFFEYNEEYGIEDTDFHFRVRKNGQWYEKMGGGPIHKVPFEEKPWDAGGLIYNSNIVYFKDLRG